MGAAQSETQLRPLGQVRPAASMKALEYQITQALMERDVQSGGEREREQQRAQPPVARLGDRIIAVLAVTVSLFVVGSFLEELIWVVLAAATVFVLGQDA